MLDKTPQRAAATRRARKRISCRKAAEAFTDETSETIVGAVIDILFPWTRRRAGLITGPARYGTAIQPTRTALCALIAELKDLERAGFIERARGGDKRAHQDLLAELAETVGDHMEIPESLQVYMEDVSWEPHRVAALAGPPRGSRPRASVRRDSRIALAVEFLVQCGLLATRKVRTEDESACSLVEKVLSEGRRTKDSIGEHAVEKIWRNNAGFISQLNVKRLVDVIGRK